MIGKTLLHYKILEELGRGGMGEVYLAEDKKLKRKVAIKFLPSHLTKDKESRERFEREAQAAAALNHPNIVTVYEIGEFEDSATADRQIFISMEYVEGETLRDKIDHFKSRSTKFPLEEIINIAIQICEGLDKAHQAGIVHRDIKPGNIIIGKENRVKILDFGLAKLKGVSQLTKETSTLGTIHYMSPEQVRGEDVDHRTDIWSLGVIMYEMLCGVKPFKGEYEQAVIYSILNEKPKLLAKFRPDLPSELQNLVDRAMARSPEDRYQNAEEIVNDLTRFEAREGDSDRHSESDVRTGKAMPQKRFWQFLAAILVVIIVPGFIYVMIISPSQDMEPSVTGTPATDGIVQDDIDNSIVVLPFKDISPTGDNEYFSDGLTEEIIADLSRIRSLRVISRTSAMTLKGTDMDIRAIGEKLDVRYVLEGSVRKAGDELKIK